MVRRQEDVPEWRVPRVPSSWDERDALLSLPWSEVSHLPPLVRADGSGPSVFPTTVRVCESDEALFVRFECEDRDIWGTYTERDDPLYEEEAVEVFLAPGGADPVEYH